MVLIPQVSKPSLISTVLYNKAGRLPPAKQEGSSLRDDVVHLLASCIYYYLGTKKETFRSFVRSSRLVPQGITSLLASIIPYPK
jgi:hypothetical protein